MKTPRILRIAAALQLIGLAVELMALNELTPVTFLGFAGIGIPLVGAGMLLYLVHVVRELRTRGAL